MWRSPLWRGATRSWGTELAALDQLPTLIQLLKQQCSHPLIYSSKMRPQEASEIAQKRRHCPTRFCCCDIQCGQMKLGGGKRLLGSQLIAHHEGKPGQESEGLRSHVTQIMECGITVKHKAIHGKHKTSKATEWDCVKTPKWHTRGRQHKHKWTMPQTKEETSLQMP